MSKNKRSWQPREMQMVTEYLAKVYTRRRWKTRVRLGSPPEALISPERARATLSKIVSGSWT